MSMPKIIRRLLQIIAAVVAVLIVLVAVLLCFLGPTIKTAAEKIGPKVLGVPMTVEKVSVNIFAGKVALRNLRVGNPPGYSSDPVFALGELVVDVKVGSLLGTNAIVVNQIAIHDLKVAYEVLKGVSNVQAIQARVQPDTGTKTAKEGPQKPERKVIIDRFECRGGMVSCRAGITLGQAVPIPLPPIIATGIGRESNGVTIISAIDRMVLEIFNSVGTAVTDFLRNVGKETIDKGADAVKSGVKGLGNALKGFKSPF